MENQIVVSQNNLQARDINTVTEEIIAIKTQAQKVLLSYVIELGRRLTEAKAMLNHGEWGAWLEEKVDFSHSTANTYMKLYEEYGSSSPFLLGLGANSQPIANLSYTKAVRLLALPKEEREEFVAENDIENKSVRETDELIKEHKRTLEEKKKLEEENARLKNYEKDAKEAQALALKAQGALSVKEKELDKIKEQLKEKEQELEEASTPSLSDEEIRKIEKEAEKEAERQAEAKFNVKLMAEKEKLAKEREKLEADIATAKAEKAKADAQAKDAESRLKDFEKQIKLQDPLITRFKTIFEDFQDKGFNLLEMIENTEKTDKETSAKFRAALNAFLEKMS